MMMQLYELIVVISDPRTFMYLVGHNSRIMDQGTIRNPKDPNPCDVSINCEFCSRYINKFFQEPL